MMRNTYLTDLMRILHSARKLLGVRAYFGRLEMPDRGPESRRLRVQLAWRDPEWPLLGNI